MAELSESLRAAVHLCIDMQRLFDAGGPWPTPWLDRVLPKVVHLVEHAPSRTIFTRFITPTTPGEARGAWRDFYLKWNSLTRGELDSNLLRLVPALEPFCPPAKIFDKAVFSAFADGRLHRALQSAGVESIVVSGAETDMCVLASVLAAVDLGYRVVIARDAVCSSSDEAHDSLVALYRQRFDVQIQVAETEEIIDAWRP